jgi:hypothetical protein
MVSSQAIQGGQAGKATGKRVQGGDKIKKKGPH